MHCSPIWSSVTLPSHESPCMQISPIQMPLTVGDTVPIICSTDLNVTTIEWIRDNITVANSNSQSLTLLLDPVSADHHNTQYTCRVSNSCGHGIQEDTVDVTVQSKLMCECCAFNTCMLVYRLHTMQADFRVHIKAL